MNIKVQLKNKEKNTLENGVIRLVKNDELDKVMDLQDKVIEWLPNKDLYYPTSKESIMRFTGEMGEIVGCFNENNELIGMGVYCKLGKDKENYGYDINISGDDLLKVAQVESTIVHKAYRGNKLQVKICGIIEDLAKKENMNLIMSTVSPDNPHSLNSFIKREYKIEKEKEKYGGLRRCILSKKL